MIRLLVCGSRDLEDKEEEIHAHLTRMFKGFVIDELICGMARGVDMISYRWAKKNNIPVKEFYAKWKELGRKAGPLRNIQMLNEGNPTHVLAFFPVGKRTTGTTHMINISTEKGIPVKIIEV